MKELSKIEDAATRAGFARSALEGLQFANVYNWSPAQWAEFYLRRARLLEMLAMAEKDLAEAVRIEIAPPA